MGVPDATNSEAPLKPRSWHQVLLADVRQGVVGNIAWVLLLLVVGAIGVLGGTVPAWVLAASVVSIGLVASVVINGMGRRIDRLQGSLEEARRRGDQAEETAKNAAASLALAAAGQEGGDLSLSPRAQGFVRRIRALRESFASQEMFLSLSQAELALIRILIEEMMQTFGRGHGTLIALKASWFGMGEDSRAESVTALNQLEVLAINFGIEELRQP